MVSSVYAASNNNSNNNSNNSNDSNNNNKNSNKDIGYDDGNQDKVDNIVNLNIDYEGTMANRLINGIFKRFTTETKFEFALYLANYAMFERNGDKDAPFANQYVQFMNKYGGINWQIV